MSRLRLLAPIVLLLAGSGLADAQVPLPSYDTERFCTWAALSEAAVKPGVDVGQIRQGCRTREITAVETLQTLWSEMPARARDWCVGQIDNAVDQVKAPTGSYELLYECLLDQTIGFVPSWN